MNEQKPQGKTKTHTHKQKTNTNGQYPVSFKDGNNDILKAVPPLYKLNTHCPKF
jgi:hypothetical protein